MRHKKVPQKLQNKKIEKAASAPLPHPADAASAENLAGTASHEAAAAAASKRDEQLLRLALGALGEKAAMDAVTERTESTGLDSTSVTTRTASAIGEEVSSIDADSILEESLPRLTSFLDIKAPEVHEPRIGIDIGDVLTSAGKDSLWEVPGAIDAVCAVAEIFGSYNVFLVSRVRLGGRMHRMTKQWLERPNGLLERTCIPADNVEFVSTINGSDGKGTAAARLGLSHFVDNKWECLEAVFADPTGNSSEFVRRFDGILFHFASGGTGRWKPKSPLSTRSKFKPHYCAVSGWSEILRLLRKGTSASLLRDGDEWMSERKRQDPELAEQASLAIAAVSSVSVHRIAVSIEDDVAFGVVNRLLGPSEKNFKYIASESGAKVLLNGKGSPHPQPASLQQEALTVCIRAKTRESLEEAITLVEDLLNDIQAEHREFKDKVGR
jgi:hypothetical protein